MLRHTRRERGGFFSFFAASRHPLALTWKPNILTQAAATKKRRERRKSPTALFCQPRLESHTQKRAREDPPVDVPQRATEAVVPGCVPFGTAGGREQKGGKEEHPPRLFTNKARRKGGEGKGRTAAMMLLRPNQEDVFSSYLQLFYPTKNLPFTTVGGT